MKASYRISEDDYVNAMKLFAKLSPRALLIYVTVALVLVLFAVFGSRLLQAGAIGGLVGGGVVSLIMRLVVSPILARRHYRKYKAIQDEFTFELLDEGIQITSPNANGLVKWDHILKWRQNSDYLLMYPMPRIYYLLPKRISATGFDVDELVRALTKHVGAET